MSTTEIISKIEALREWESLIANAQEEAEALRDSIKAISIHASVQNATSTHQDRYSSRADFNPRTRTECDGNNINDFRIPVYNV